MTNRELDVLIAEKVFGAKITFLNQKCGWRIDYTADKDECNDPITTDMGNDGYRLKNYSIDIKAAFEVVEELRIWTKAFSLVTIVHMDQSNELEWMAQWEFHNPLNYDFVFATNESAPKAICEATLKLLEKTK